jgi:hypothetical protein
MSTILRDDRPQQAIDAVQATSKAAFPEEQFTAHHGVDPEGINIDANTKADDGFAVLDRVSDRLGYLLIEEGRAIDRSYLQEVESRLQTMLKGIGAAFAALIVTMQGKLCLTADGTSAESVFHSFIRM